MYGLVATKGKEAGTPTKNPWRVAYVNSSLGTRPTANATDLISIPHALDRIPLLLRVIPRRSSASYMNASVMMFVVVILMYLRTPQPPCLRTIISFLPQLFRGSILPCRSGYNEGPVCPWRQIGSKYSTSTKWRRLRGPPRGRLRVSPTLEAMWPQLATIMSNQEATRVNTSRLVKRFWIRHASSSTWRVRLRCWGL